jgi:hypothetical protein
MPASTLPHRRWSDHSNGETRALEKRAQPVFQVIPEIAPEITD